MPNPKVGIEISAKDKTKSAFNDVNRGLSEMQSKLGTVTTAVLGLAGAGSLGALVAMQSRATTEAVRYANALDMSSQELIAWQSAARTAGIEGDKMSDIFKDVSEKIGDAVQGGGEAAEVLERMNLNARDMAALAPDQQMLKIAEGLQQIGTQSEKVQILEALGSDASLLLPLLDDNAAKLRTLREESIAYGEALSDVDAQKIKQASEAFDRTGRVVAGVGRIIAAEVAPYVEAMANQFADAAKEHRGFSEEVTTGMEWIATSVGVVADAYRYLEIVFDTVRLGGAQLVSGLSVGIARLDELISEFIDNVPGLDAKPSPSLQIWAQATELAVDDAAASLQALMEGPLPSEGIKAAFDEIQRKADETAAKITESLNAGGGGPVGSFTPAGGDDKAAREEEKYRARLQQRVDALNQTLMTEQELELFRMEEKQLLVEEAFQEGLLKQAERNAMLQDLEAQHQDKMNQIAYQGMAIHEKFATAFRKGDLKNVLQWGAQMTQGVAQQNEAMFKINKAFALAQAAISLPSAVIQSFERAGGYPWGLIPAGLMLAQGMAQIQAIRSANYSGGGGGGVPPSLAGSGAGSVVATVPAGGDEITGFGSGDTGGRKEFTINDIDDGEIYSGTTVRKLMELIAEQQADGMTLVLPA